MIALAPVTQSDLDILVEADLLTPEQAATVEIISDEEMREAMARKWAYLVRHKSYDSFWRGYRVAAADAAAALAAVEKPSLLRRLFGWLS